MLSTLLTDLGTGLANFGTSFVLMLYNMFIGLFFDTTETATTLNELGTVALMFIVVGLVSSWTKTVAGWLRLKSSQRRAAKSKKKA